MRLTAYQLTENPPEIRPAILERSWMNETPKRYAYLCLPLTMANRSGWELLNPLAFTAVWNGGSGSDAIRIESLSMEGVIARSHFGSGVITFTTGHLFRTEPGHNLLVRGSPNMVKDGLAPLEGIVETDWLPYPFTMNWKITRPNLEIAFDAGEPFCFISPTPRSYLAGFSPDLGEIGADHKEWNEYNAWLRERKRFDDARQDSRSDEAAQGWAKHYLRGGAPWNEPFRDHETRLEIKPFVRRVV